jgi:hypothetical protein
LHEVSHLFIAIQDIVILVRASGTPEVLQVCIVEITPAGRTGEM